MIPQLVPLFSFVSFLAAIYCIIQVFKQTNTKELKLSPKSKTYEWSDAFGLARGVLGIVCWWGLYLGTRIIIK